MSSLIARSWLPACLAITTLAASTTGAATLVWDPAGAGGGTGTWDTTATDWDNDGSAVAWSNATGDTASFGGSAGTVTLSEAITAGGLGFTVDGYTVTGNTLTISGGGALNVGSGLSATLASELSAADGIDKTGAGTLTVSGAYANTGTGVITVSEGTLRMAQSGLAANTNGWGNGRAIEVASGATLEAAANWMAGTQGRLVTLNGGTLSLVNGSSTDSFNYVNNLVLNDGASVIGNAMRMAYYAEGLVTVGGASASTISAGISLQNFGGRKATFDVADVTNSPAPDLTVSGVIRNAVVPVVKDGVETCC